MRHAQVRYFEGLDPEEVVLTEEGRRQAAAAAEALAGVTFDRVVTSGLARTLETAAIVAPGREPGLRPGELGAVPQHVGTDVAEQQRSHVVAHRPASKMDRSERPRQMRPLRRHPRMPPCWPHRFGGAIGAADGDIGGPRLVGNGVEPH